MSDRPRHKAANVVSARLTGVVIEALDVEAQARFWAQALQWRLADGIAVGKQVAIRPGRADGIGLLFVYSTRPKTGKNRLHLDLAGGPGQARQVRRLLALGASRVDIGQGKVPWEVLADPEGNEFCVIPDTETVDGLDAICLDAADPAAQGRFWTAATGWQLVDRGDWGVSLRATSGTGPALVMGPPVAPKSGRNRLQLNLATGPGTRMSSETARLLAAGASRVDTGHREGDPQMLADPEGNEFRLAKPGGTAHQS